MKVLFINKYENSGGAAIAAQRIGEGLERYYHTQNHFLAGIHRKAAANVTVTRSGAVANFIERGINVLSNRLGLQYFYFPFSTPAILQCARAFKPDVISLHNIHGGYFDTSLLPKLSACAPIVWTLHDMWAITGNAAHTFGDTSWKAAKAGPGEHKHAPAIGFPTGNYLIKRKQRLYAESDLHIVSPSRWLYDMTTESPLTKHQPLYHIPNPIDTDYFKAQDKAASRQALGLPVDARVITFVSERLFNSEFKGGDELLKILHLLDEQLDREVHLLMIGRDRLPGTFKHLKCVYTGYVKAVDKMMQCYSASDIFFYPTKADNLPNVLIEAGSCETACITFDVGGCREIVLDGKTGYVIAPGMHEQFAAKTLSLLQHPDRCREFGKAARAYMEQHFGMKVIAEQYHRLFASVIRY
ncbi:glycosyltransferase involved in cell wall biosynthesis [Chitinophaga niastensis]|uniref:Glycosyltransferase involved in cell wall biosynthesis n=1 Tax=Chitinophaga niastensis TaxID=536980 RepID=A0A2P8HFH1_CHINA|nr:glycosyltransferase [Chitinophaga niastensis]PSL44944.1 glycosyltransferase involved in cell wall biosynthesis [Chitinophaga niastensis]